MNDDFQRFLQDLVSDAVSVTPPPPDLAGHVPSPKRRPWITWVLPITAVAATIAIVLAFVVTSGDDEEVRTVPATDPATTVVTTTSPTTTEVSTTSAVATVPASTIAAPDEAAPVTPLDLEPPPSVVTAGDDGVWVVAGTERVQWVTEPIARAVLTERGLIVQRRSGSYDLDVTPESTRLFSVAAPLSPLEPFLDGIDWGVETPYLVLHDAAVIDGSLEVLVEVASQQINIESPSAPLVLAGEDGSVDVVTDHISGWESGTSRLRLTTGLVIVGEFNAEATTGPTVLGTGRTLTPDISATGLAESYSDCSDCPHHFTISRDGTTMAWIEGDDLVRFDLSTSTARPRIPLGDDAVNVAELTITDGAAVLDRFDAAPLLVLFRDGVPSFAELPGRSGSLAPDFLTTPWTDASADFPDGVEVPVVGEGDAATVRLQRVRQLVERRSDDCPDQPRRITRLDDATIRVRFGCDDAGGGIDYRVAVASAGRQTERLTVVRRTICLRGVSDGLCV